MKRGIVLLTLLAVVAAFVFASPSSESTTTTTQPAAAAAAGKYKGAPWFAQQVASGQLPAVDQRLPKEPVVVRPGDGYTWYENGTYTRGAVVRDATDVPNMQGATDYTIPFWSNPFTGEVMPYGWKGWEKNADNTVWTFFLREGMKWSDGQPYTADDVLFWYNDLQMNPEYLKGIGAAAPNAVAAETVKLEKVNDYTLRFILKGANPNFANLVAQRTEREIMGHPAKYLKQFHPKFADAATLAAKVKAGGFDTWMQLLRWEKDIYGAANPKVPTLMPWSPKEPPPANPAVWTANPFFWIVDEIGQQLPYLEQARYFLVSDAEAQKLRILQGQNTWANLALDALPLAKDAKAKGTINFQLTQRVKPDAYKSTTSIFNMNAPDEFKRGLFRDLRFRQAWSLFVPRDKINQIMYQGACMPTLGGFTVSGSSHPWYEPTLGTSPLIKQDIARANQLLDQMGLANKDKDGFRLGPDGKPILLGFGTVTHPEWEGVANIILEDLKLIGFKANLRTVTWGGLADANREHKWEIWIDQSTEAWESQLPERTDLIAPTGRFGIMNWAYDWWTWLDTGGKSGEEPPKEIKDNYALWKQMNQEADKAKLAELTKEWYRRQAQQVWSVPHLTFPPPLNVVQPNAGNWNLKTGQFFAPGAFYKGQEIK